MAVMFVLIACEPTGRRNVGDPGWSFTVMNPCAESVWVFVLEDESPSPRDVSRIDSIPPNTATQIRVIDDDRESYGIRLVSGPRAGHLIRSSNRVVAIPTDACPTMGEKGSSAR
jgi:hypothetical protein